MKSFFLTFCLLALFIHLVDCVENDTFSYLLDVFYAKGEQWKMHLRPNYDFVVNITDNKKEVEDMFEPSIRDYVYMGTRVDLINKIPEYHVCANYRTRGILQYKLINDAVEERDKTVKLKMECAKELALRLPYKTDQVLMFSLLNWSRNQPEDTDLNRVQNSFEEMKSKHTKLRIVFDTEISSAKELLNNINGNIYLANVMIEELLEGSNLPTAGLENLIRITNQVSSNRITLINHLKIIWNTLLEYNKQRIRWAEVIIGMRDTLTSKRKPIGMDARARYNYRV